MSTKYEASETEVKHEGMSQGVIAWEILGNSGFSLSKAFSSEQHANEIAKLMTLAAYHEREVVREEYVDKHRQAAMARMEKVSPERRKEIARHAANVRWSKVPDEEEDIKT